MNRNSVQEEIKEQFEVQECLLSFGGESFASQSAFRKYKV